MWLVNGGRELGRRDRPLRGEPKHTPVKLTTPSKTKQFTNSESRVLFVFIILYCSLDSFIGDMVHIPRATGVDFCKHLYAF